MKKNPDGSIELTITIPWAQVQKAYQDAVEEAVREAEIPGFRKGKAPREKVEAGLDKNHVYSHALQHLLPPAYAQVVKDHNLKPVLYPQIKIDKGQEGEDWIFTATTCEAPEVSLPDYKAGIPALKIPKDATQEQKLQSVLDYLLKESKIVLPDILIQEEANHRLSLLIDNLGRLGMTTDQYLASKKLTPETLRAQHAQEARANLSLEFILQSISEKEKIEGEDKRRKTLDFLLKLV